jgi:hypothetical protein
MYSRVEKVFIGKDISRTSSAVVFPYLNGSSTAQNAAEGEIFVLDKNKNIMAAGATVADSDVIYIAEVLGGTQTYANEAGTSITANKVIISDPIVGKYVTNYSGRAYTAKAEKTAVFTLTGTTSGRETIVRIVYKDIKEHPGQFTHTYRFFESGTAATDATALCALINKHSGARVTASPSTAQVTLTGKAIPECTTALTDIDEFKMVDFEVFITYVSSTGVRTDYNLSIAYTGPTYGVGTWEQVRDAEKKVITNQFGPTNRITFPVVEPAKRTIKSETYDVVNIESEVAFVTPDNGYNKRTKVGTKLFIPNTATSNQMSTVLTVLNPWMESAGQASISF